MHIYIGTRQDGLYVDNQRGPSNQARTVFYKELDTILSIEPFCRLRSRLAINKLIFARQSHGVDGLIIDSATSASVRPWACEADYIITTMPGIGIGILTADCLPIILYDPVKNAVGIVHAGWRGTVNSIVVKAVQAMGEQFECLPSTIQCIYGPAARPCCYTVGDELIQSLPAHKPGLSIHKGKPVFDLIGYNTELLREIGVKNFIDTLYVTCTICDDRFFSHRRDGRQAGRTITVVSI